MVNVENAVGPSEANSIKDVKVVQRLTQLGAPGFGSTAAKVGIPRPTGNFDAVTGFWIYHFQKIQHASGAKAVIIDGLVSPARAADYAFHAHFTIVQMNVIAQANNPSEYEAFLNSGGSV